MVVERRVSPDIVVQQLRLVTSHYTPSLIPGGELAHAESFRAMYADVLSIAESLTARKIYANIVEFDGRPVFFMSNRPIPDNINGYAPDVTIFVHGDTVVVPVPEEQGASYVEGEFFHGAGGGDMKHNFLSAAAAVALAPDGVSVTLFGYTNEEKGGHDVEELFKRGFSTKVALCADGAAIDEMALADSERRGQKASNISFVTRAKGALRVIVEIPRGSVPVAHASKPWLGAQPPLPERLMRLIGDINKISKGTRKSAEPAPIASTVTIGELHGGDADSITMGWLLATLDIRGGTEKKLQAAFEALQRIGPKHGFVVHEPYMVGDIYRADTDNEPTEIYRGVGGAVMGKPMILRPDMGASDLRIVKKYLKNNVVCLLSGIRGDNWHASLQERVLIAAVSELIDIYGTFVQRVGPALEPKRKNRSPQIA